MKPGRSRGAPEYRWTSRGSVFGRQGLALALAAAVGIGAGCARRETPAGPGVTTLPIEILEVTPAPREQFAPYHDPAISARFAVPLDSSTVTPLNVYLKVDTRRIPILVRWDAPTQRILATPVAPLALLQTYTVELSPQLRSADGIELGRAFSWQFRTSSVRLPSSPFPDSGAVGESPFTSLRWGGNDSTSGGQRYELIVGSDSALVVSHTAPVAYLGPLTTFRPPVRWPEGQTVFWTVRVTNTTTGERVDGPLWRFTPAVVANVQTDSLVVSYSQWGYNQFISDRWQRFCGVQVLISGLSQNVCAIRWSLNQVPQESRLASARIELAVQPGWEGGIVGDESVSSTTASWLCGQIGPGGPPYPSEALAFGTPISSRILRFENDPLSIHIAATIGRPDRFFGYLVRSQREIHWVGPFAAEPDLAPKLVVYYYTLPHGPRPATLSATRSGGREASMRRARP